MKGKKILVFTIIVSLSLSLFMFSGCDLIAGWLGLNDGNTPNVTLTLTAPEDRESFSQVDSVTFEGNYANVDSIKLKVGDNVYDTMDVFTNGKWAVTVKLSDVGIGNWQVVASAYVEGQTTPAKTTNPINITVYNWLNATNNGIYRYIILNDSDYSGYPAVATGIATEGTYAYVSGYYIVDSSNIQPFLYRIDPELGTYDKKAVLNSIYTAGGELLPVLVALGNDKEYLAYSAEGMNIHIKALDSNLNPAFSYDDDGYSYIFRGLYYKDGYLYLTGEDYAAHEALIFKIQDTGSLFGEPSTATYNPYQNGSTGYDITVVDNNIYVAAMVKNTSATDLNRVVWKFDNNLVHQASSNNETIDGEMYGIYYCASTKKLYATGVLPDAGSDYKTVFADGMDPNDIYLSALDHHFHQSHNAGTFHDEEGRGIFYDSATSPNQAVIVGFQQATDSSMTNAKGSICVRNGASEVKTVYFAEDNYSESCLNRVTKIGDKYYAVGYAKDTNGKHALIMWIPDSY